jgi:hypothetical protein
MRIAMEGHGNNGNGRYHDDDLLSSDPVHFSGDYKRINTDSGRYSCVVILLAILAEKSSVTYI